jgi:hypothetical protein
MALLNSPFFFNLALKIKTKPSTQAESQWIVEQVYSQHLQYLEAIKSSAKDLSLPIFEIAIDLTVRMKLGRSLFISCNKGFKLSLISR